MGEVAAGGVIFVPDEESESGVGAGFAVEAGVRVGGVLGACEGKGKIGGEEGCAGVDAFPGACLEREMVKARKRKLAENNKDEV